VTVWHDEADRFGRSGHLDPPDRCLCTECCAERVEAFLERRSEMGGVDPMTPMFALDGGRYQLQYHDLRVLVAVARSLPTPEPPYQSVTGETEIPEDGSAPEPKPDSSEVESTP